jgi:hypothetical protein
MLSLFSEPVATPCRKSTGQCRPNPPTEARQEKRDHIVYLPYIQWTTDHISRLQKQQGIHNIQKPVYKMVSIFKSTKER